MDEGDDLAIELLARRDDAEGRSSDVCGGDEELAAMLRVEPVDLDA